MKLEKAIEILDDFHKDPNAFYTPDLPAAIKLGIEALKRISHTRYESKAYKQSPLPGESL